MYTILKIRFCYLNSQKKNPILAFKYTQREIFAHRKKIMQSLLIVMMMMFFFILPHFMMPQS
jgi:hypothetical protein